MTIPNTRSLDPGSPGMCLKPVVNNGINYQPQLVIAGWFLTHQQYYSTSSAKQANLTKLLGVHIYIYISVRKKLQTLVFQGPKWLLVIFTDRWSQTWFHYLPFFGRWSNLNNISWDEVKPTSRFLLPHNSFTLLQRLFVLVRWPSAKPIYIYMSFWWMSTMRMIVTPAAFPLGTGSSIQPKPSTKVISLLFPSPLMQSGQFITTSAEVTPNGGLVSKSPPKWP